MTTHLCIKENKELNSYDVYEIEIKDSLIELLLISLKKQYSTTIGDDTIADIFGRAFPAGEMLQYMNLNHLIGLYTVTSHKPIESVTLEKERQFTTALLQQLLDILMADAAVTKLGKLSGGRMIMSSYPMELLQSIPAFHSLTQRLIEAPMVEDDTLEQVCGLGPKTRRMELISLKDTK